MSIASTSLDAQIEIVTPENIAFHYRLAGPFQRLPAYLLDLLIRVIALAVAGVAILMTTSIIGIRDIGIGVWLVIWFVTSWFYGGIFEVYWNGQTPGKRWLRLRVVTVEGQPINALQAVLRNVLREVDLLPAIPWMPVPTGMIGLGSTMMSRRYQRLGDLACGTMVIVEERHQLHGVQAIRDPAVLALAEQLPAKWPASRSLAQALSMYVGRRRTFSPSRRIELAKILGQPLVDELGLPIDTNHDLLLCALYNRTFASDRLPQDGDSGSAPWLQTDASPFAAESPLGTGSPFAANAQSNQTYPNFATAGRRRL